MHYLTFIFNITHEESVYTHAELSSRAICHYYELLVNWLISLFVSLSSSCQFYFPHSLLSFVLINVGANPVLDAGEILSLEYEQKWLFEHRETFANVLLMIQIQPT